MKTRHKPEQIIHKLRQAEVFLGQGKKTEEKIGREPLQMN